MERPRPNNPDKPKRRGQTRRSGTTERRGNDTARTLNATGRADGLPARYPVQGRRNGR